jgi:hypothetical protein
MLVVGPNISPLAQRSYRNHVLTLQTLYGSGKNVVWKPLTDMGMPDREEASCTAINALLGW